VREGDIVVAINSQDVASIDDIHRSLAEWQIGKTLTLTIVRGKNRVDLEVVPTEAS
jgi:S1-C subfamily serine protease